MRAIMTAVAILVLAGGLGTVPAAGLGAETSSSRSQRLVVVFNGSTIPFGAEDAIRGFGGTVVRRIPQIGVLVVGSSGPAIEDLAAALRGLQAVEAVGRDFVVSLGLPSGFEEVGAGGGGDVSASGHTPPNFGFMPPFLTPGIPLSAFDAFYPSQQWSLTRIGANPPTWALSTGADVTIAFLDSGVSAVHPDIAPNLVSAVSLVDVSEDIPLCDDGTAVDQLGHGTLVASLAAGARGLGTGFVVGVAPDADIRSYKVLRRKAFTGVIPPPFADTPVNRCLLGSGEGEFSWLLEGISQAVDDGADVIVISAGGFIDKRDHEDLKAAYTALLRTTNRAFARGVVIVAAAGNDALDLDNLGPRVHLPSELPHVILVTATTNPAFPPPGKATGIDHLASYSNFGSSLHGLAAPGGEGPSPPADRLVRGACSPGIPGTLVGLPQEGKSFGCFFIGFPGTAPSLTFNHVWYARANGTSFAAPHVAGVVALVKSVNPALTPSQIRTILQQTAEDIGKRGYDEFFNYGLINAPDAVQRALSP